MYSKKSIPHELLILIPNNHKDLSRVIIRPIDKKAPKTSKETVARYCKESNFDATSVEEIIIANKDIRLYLTEDSFSYNRKFFIKLRMEHDNLIGYNNLIIFVEFGNFISELSKVNNVVDGKLNGTFSLLPEQLGSCINIFSLVAEIDSTESSTIKLAKLVGTFKSTKKATSKRIVGNKYVNKKTLMEFIYLGEVENIITTYYSLSIQHPLSRYSYRSFRKCNRRLLLNTSNPSFEDFKKIYGKDLTSKIDLEDLIRHYLELCKIDYLKYVDIICLELIDNKNLSYDLGTNTEIMIPIGKNASSAVKSTVLNYLNTFIKKSNRRLGLDIYYDNNKFDLFYFNVFIKYLPEEFTNYYNEEFLIEDLVDLEKSYLRQNYSFNNCDRLTDFIEKINEICPSFKFKTSEIFEKVKKELNHE